MSNNPSKLDDFNLHSVSTTDIHDFSSEETMNKVLRGVLLRVVEEVGNSPISKQIFEGIASGALKLSDVLSPWIELQQTLPPKNNIQVERSTRGVTTCTPVVPRNKSPCSLCKLHKQGCKPIPSIGADVSPLCERCQSRGMSICDVGYRKVQFITNLAEPDSSRQANAGFQVPVMFIPSSLNDQLFPMHQTGSIQPDSLYLTHGNVEDNAQTQGAGSSATAFELEIIASAIAPDPNVSSYSNQSGADIIQTFQDANTIDFHSFSASGGTGTDIGFDWTHWSMED